MFCELLEHLWCFLDGFWSLLVGPGKLLLVFFMDFANLGAGPPGAVLPAGPPVPMVTLRLFFDVICWDFKDFGETL